jgi:hypothetical protein
VSLVLPIFRSATAHVVNRALFLAGDSGVQELLPVSGDPAQDPAPTTDPLRHVVTAAGADVAGAPEDAIRLGDAQFCGFDDTGVEGMWSTARNDTGRRCLLDAHLAGQPAVFVAMSATVEGDPIVIVVRTGRDATGAVFTDESRDRNGGSQRGWTTSSCPRLTTRFPQAPEPPPPTWFQCAEGPALTTPTGDVTPPWFTERDLLPLCGYDVRIEDNDHARRACFRDAVASGTPAEFAYIEHADEGERVARWFRVATDGTFEAIERQLPNDTPGGNISESWNRYACESFEFTSAPNSDADNLPTLDTCTPVESVE